MLTAEYPYLGIEGPKGQDKVPNGQVVVGTFLGHQWESLNLCFNHHVRCYCKGMHVVVSLGKGDNIWAQAFCEENNNPSS